MTSAATSTYIEVKAFDFSKQELLKLSKPKVVLFGDSNTFGKKCVPMQVSKTTEAMEARE